MKKGKFTTVVTTSVAAVLLSAALNPAIAQAATALPEQTSQKVPTAPAQATTATHETAPAMTAPAPMTAADDAESASVTNDNELTPAATVTTPAADAVVAPTTTEKPTEATSTTPTTEMAEEVASESAAPTESIVATETAAPTAEQPASEPTTPAMNTTKLPPAERADQDINVWMPNQTLQKIVLYWLNQNSDQAGKTWTEVGQITKDDLKYLTTLSNYTGLPTTGEYRALRNTYIDGTSSYSLAGLEYATNLTTLYLRSADLNTAETEAVRGDITDISPLASLKKLTFIELTGNRITDVTPVAQLSAVKELHLEYNSIADLSSLNPAQYDTLQYNDQFVVLPVAYVDPKVDRYQMPLDQIKLPGGKKAEVALTKGAGSAVRILFDASRYFYKGGEGQEENGQIVYSKFREQKTPGFTELPNLPTKVIQNPYYFYMSSIAGEQKGDTTFQIFQPYLLQKDQGEIIAKDIEIYVGDEWDPEDGLGVAYDHDGNEIDFDKIKVIGEVDTTKPGVYPVTYEYDGISDTANVTVLEDQMTLVVHDMTMYVREENVNLWDAVDSATDRDGNPVSLDKIAITGDVDVNTPGVYELIYYNNWLTKKVKLTVLPDQTAVTAHDQTLVVGDKWDPQTSFDQVVDRDGKPVPFDQVKVTGAVDVNTPGEYEVTYQNGAASKTIKVTVIEDQTSISAHKQDITVGDKWDPAAGFDAATDREGKPVSFDKITVTGEVNTNKPGRYEVTYHNGDVSETVTVVVHNSDAAGGGVEGPDGGDENGNTPGTDGGDENGNTPGTDGGDENGNKPGPDGGDENGNKPGTDGGDENSNKPDPDGGDENGNKPGPNGGDENGNKPGPDGSNENGNKPGTDNGNSNDPQAPQPEPQKPTPQPNQNQTTGNAQTGQVENVKKKSPQPAKAPTTTDQAQRPILPKTGETRSGYLTAVIGLGLFLISGLGLGFLFRRRRQ